MLGSAASGQTPAPGRIREFARPGRLHNRSHPTGQRRWPTALKAHGTPSDDDGLAPHPRAASLPGGPGRPALGTGRRGRPAGLAPGAGGPPAARPAGPPALAGRASSAGARQPAPAAAAPQEPSRPRLGAGHRHPWPCKRRYNAWAPSSCCPTCTCPRTTNSASGSTTPAGAGGRPTSTPCNSNCRRLNWPAGSTTPCAWPWTPSACNPTPKPPARTGAAALPGPRPRPRAAGARCPRRHAGPRTWHGAQQRHAGAAPVGGPGPLAGRGRRPQCHQPPAGTAVPPEHGTATPAPPHRPGRALSELQRALQPGQVVLLLGEAGMGKSRLIAEAMNGRPHP